MVNVYDVKQTVVEGSEPEKKRYSFNILKTKKSSYFGDISHPCCMKAPSANHKLFSIVKSLVNVGPLAVSSTCHSYGLNLLTRNRTTLTPRYEITMHTQICKLSGSMNEKTPGFCFSGFLIMMLMPSCMNGFEKSMTRSRCDVIVSGAIAMSASCRLHTVCHVIQ